MATQSKENLMDPTDQVVVMREHLAEWHEVVRRAHGHLSAEDLAYGFRTGKIGNTQLTRMAERALQRIEGYLVEDVSPD